MSQSIIEKFLAYVKENKELQDELEAIGSDIEKITQFANAKGYDFTTSDFKLFADIKQVELSEDDLDNVAGGVLKIFMFNKQN